MTKQVLINKEIPRTMTLEGLEYLGRLAQQVPENGLIVEVGPLFGSSTWVLAKNSHPSVKVISIDTWEPQKWIDKVEEKFPGCVPFSKDAFLHYVSDCDNVEAIQGWSPQVMKDFDGMIDLFFDDATHGDPGFSESLEFYVPKIRANGIVCGDDFAYGWPDIVKRVNELADSWGVFPEVIGRVWAMMKPIKNGSQPVRVHETLGASRTSDFFGTVISKDGRYYDGPCRIWLGGLHTSNILQYLKIEWDKKLSGGSIEMNLNGGNGDSISLECAPDKSIDVSLASGLTHFDMKLVGDISESHNIIYQACYLNTETGKTSNTKSFMNGESTLQEDNSHLIVALRFRLEAKK